jgi:integrase/recombinase XerD
VAGVPIDIGDGRRYWTVIDGDYRVARSVDDFPQHLFFGRNLAANTTAAYAGSLVLFLTWLHRSGIGVEEARSRLGRFMTFLRHYDPKRPQQIVGPGLSPVRSGRRGNAILAAVRDFYKFEVERGSIPAAALQSLYAATLSSHEHSERRVREPVVRPRHCFPVEQSPVDNATRDEVTALLGACRSERDVFVVLLLAVAGLRRGEAVGLRTEDLHLMEDSTGLGCHVAGAHLHVVRRDNVNRASAKRGNRVVPAHPLLVGAYDDYWLARARVAAARVSGYVLVNLYRTPLGRPMALKAVNDLIGALAKRAGLHRLITPHMLRHFFGTEVRALCGAVDVVRELLGHQSIASSQIYIHPNEDRRRAAVHAIEFPFPSRSAAEVGW